MSILGVLESAATAAEEALTEARGKEAASVLPEIEDIGDRMDADAKRIAKLANDTDRRRNPVTTRREIRNIILLTLALCLLGCGGTPPTPSPSPPCTADMGTQLVSCEPGDASALKLAGVITGQIPDDEAIDGTEPTRGAEQRAILALPEEDLAEIQQSNMAKLSDERAEK